MKFITQALLAVTATVMFSPPMAYAAADRYEIDKSHTRILFYVNHLGFSDMIGEFTDYDGYFIFDPQKPEDSKIEVTLHPTGIRTSSKALDDKLQGDDFFKTDKFPDIKFSSEKILITGKDSGMAGGSLSMLGVTKPFTMSIKLNKADYNQYSKDFVAGFNATARLKRSEFGMLSYIPAVGDEVRVEIQLEGINATRKEQESLKHK